MKQEEIDPKQTGCCKDTAAIQDETGCCGGADMQDDGGCCGGAGMQDETGCCRGAGMQDEMTGCCGNAYGEKMPNDPQEGCLEPQPETGSLEQFQRIVAETNDKYIRLYSEFDNFKKRMAKERMALTDKANEQTLKELLPIVDDFERCITVLQTDKTVIQKATQEGIKLIYDKLTAFLQKCNVTEMPLAPGSPFNADLHEAIMQQSAATAEMKGKIMAVVEKGYLINAYVLRFAKVVIGV